MTNELNYPNWFMPVSHYFSKHLKEYIGKSNLLFLQIGAYTGDASKWLIDNILTNKTSVLVDVDTWHGSDENIHKKFNWNDVENVYDNKVGMYENIIKNKQSSKEFLTNDSKMYDFIYIDGDHSYDAVYLDAKLSWNLLKEGAILAFDDYQWVHDSGDIYKTPRLAIDKFLEEYKDNLTIMEISGQVWVRKNNVHGFNA